jgi:hypothetical protein
MNLNKGLFQKKPFSYIKFENNILNQELYNKLCIQFPEYKDEYKNSSYKRFNMNMLFILNKQLKISNEWKTFIDYHTSIKFFYELCDKFDFNKDCYKSCSPRNTNDETDIKVDFQFAYNSKNTSSHKEFIRIPHLDNHDKIFVILMYFPIYNKTYTEKDNGSLLIYKKKNDDDDTIELINNITLIDKINYDHNCGIVFKNDKNAVHTPLRLNNHKDEQRRFVNIIFIDNKK